MGIKKEKRQSLVAGIKRYQENERLKEKYDLQKQQVVVVEPSSLLLFLGRMVELLFRIIWISLLVGLACIGLISLIYPTTREALLVILLQLYQEGRGYF